MSGFQVKIAAALDQLDETTSWLERTLEDRQKSDFLALGGLLRSADIVAELRDASTNIRQETQEAMRLVEKYNEFKRLWLRWSGAFDTLITHQEVLDESGLHNEYRDLIGRAAILHSYENVRLQDENVRLQDENVRLRDELSTLRSFL